MSERRAENTVWLVEQACDIVSMDGVSHGLQPGFVIFAFGSAHDDPVQVVFGNANVFAACVKAREALCGALSLPKTLVAAKVTRLDLGCLEMSCALKRFNQRREVPRAGLLPSPTEIPARSAAAPRATG